MNNAINCTLAREARLNTKKCTTKEAEASYSSAIHLNTVQGEILQFTGERAASLQHKFYMEIRDTVKAHMQSSRDSAWRDHIKSLTVQGNTLALAVAEPCDLSWKSFMFDLKHGTMKFLLNASIDTLPTQANLKRWKKSVPDMCPLCMGRQTTNHVINMWEKRQAAGLGDITVLSVMWSTVLTQRNTQFSATSPATQPPVEGLCLQRSA